MLNVKNMNHTQTNTLTKEYFQLYLHTILGHGFGFDERVLINAVSGRKSCYKKYLHHLGTNLFANNQKKFAILFHSKPVYRLGPHNSNTVKSKFHLIQTFVKILASFLSLQW